LPTLLHGDRYRIRDGQHERDFHTLVLVDEAEEERDGEENRADAAVDGGAISQRERDVPLTDGRPSSRR